MIFTIIVCILGGLATFGFILYVLSKIQDGMENQYDEYKDVIDEES